MSKSSYNVFMKKSLPFAHAKSLFEVPPSFFERIGVKVLLCDLDNTLIPYGSKEPTPELIAYRDVLAEKGIQMVVCSNGRGGRVLEVSQKAGLEARGWMKKPFKGPLVRLMKEKGWKPSEVLLAGDQIQTDVLCGNRAGIRVLLTEPLGAYEPLWTKFNRLFDKPKRKKMFARHWIKEWKEIET